MTLYDLETWTLRKLEQKYLKTFEMWYSRRMEKVKCSKKVTNKKGFERIGEKRTLLNNIVRRKVNWIDRILRRNWLLQKPLKDR